VHYFIRLFRQFGSESGLNIQFLDKSIMVGEVLPHTPTFISWPQHFTQITQFTLPYKLKISHFHLFTPFHPTLSRKHSQKNNTCITEPFFGGKFSDFVFLSLESTSVTGNYWLRSSGFAFGSKKSFFNVWLNRLPLLDWKLFTPSTLIQNKLENFSLPPLREPWITFSSPLMLKSTLYSLNIF
jgi:hypothetical protein